MPISTRLHLGPLPRAKLLHGERRSWTLLRQVMFNLSLVMMILAGATSLFSRPEMTVSSPNDVGTSVREEMPELSFWMNPLRSGVPKLRRRPVGLQPW